MIRVLDEGREHGDPYTWAATCRFVDRETVEVLGVAKAPKPSEWKAVLRCLSEVGAETVAYTRHRDGVMQVRRRATS